MKAVTRPIHVDYFIINLDSTVRLTEWIMSFKDNPKRIMNYESGGLLRIQQSDGLYYVNDGDIIVRYLNSHYRTMSQANFASKFDIIKEGIENKDERVPDCNVY
jgi:hypothetical protein